MPDGFDTVDERRTVTLRLLEMCEVAFCRSRGKIVMYGILSTECVLAVKRR